MLPTRKAHADASDSVRAIDVRDDTREAIAAGAIYAAEHNMWLPRRLLAGAALAGVFALMAHSEYVVVHVLHVLLLMPLLMALPVVVAWMWPVLLGAPARASYQPDAAAQQFVERLINLGLGLNWELGGFHSKI